MKKVLVVVEQLLRSRLEEEEKEDEVEEGEEEGEEEEKGRGETTHRSMTHQDCSSMVLDDTVKAVQCCQPDLPHVTRQAQLVNDM